MGEQNKYNRHAIEPLFHSDTVSPVIQNSLFAYQYQLYWKAKEAVLIYYGVNIEAK